MNEIYHPKISEDAEQANVIRWASYQENAWPKLKNLYHVPNEGKRGKYAAGTAKTVGLKAGVPDLILDSPSGIYPGLRIEMKVLPNKPTQSQLDWLRRLQQSGYCVAICYDSESAIELITQYIKLKPSGKLSLSTDPKYQVPVLKHNKARVIG